MQNPIGVYKERKDKLSNLLIQVKKQLLFSSMLRLVVFILAIFAIYFFYQHTNYILLIVLFTAMAFLFLVSRHANLNYKKDRLSTLISINETELLVLERKFYQLSEGDEFIDREHFYSQDIDLFGKGSFYQYQ